MNATSLIALASLSALAGNLVHWHYRSMERLLYFPRTGLWKAILGGWIVGTLLAAPYALGGKIPGAFFIGTAAGLVIVHQIYCICQRQRQRRQT